ncbi:uncharacterized protein LOC123555845 [Mercenaria mercenaria]|uniref:uncharacterized protein LOC123555845 n=1 Tax=Mercenaria mercenaria TaxID=6596 RepID=UPI00234F82FB|nr:uncharacterized protein LOC123555845 [Mercenaria mercenaria]
MESLLDEVDSLITPGLSTDTPEWCSNCQSLKQEIKRLQDEQIQNFGKLKQKIISTDLLIKKYKSKCDDYDVQCKRNEEANKRADKYQRQCEILETQLKAALLDTEPLRKTKITLEAEIRLKNAELQSMSDRMLAVESAQKQYEHLSKASSHDVDKLEAEKKDLLAKIKSMEAGKLTKEAAKEFKHEISSLKREKAAMLKNEKRLESKLSGALTRIEHLTTVLKERKFSPKRRRRTSSGNISSPLKSPTRSPRGHSPRDYRPSPIGRRRSRTLSERQSESQNIDVISSPHGKEKLEPGSASSSEDSDDCKSLCSVSWTFSPLMKCLSPLPPSPACFAERKIKRQKDSVEMDDEGEVSDIADVLEQQLLEDDAQQQIILTGKETEEKITENVNNTDEETLGKYKDEQIVKDSTDVSKTFGEIINVNDLETLKPKAKVENGGKQDKNCNPVKVTDAFSAEGDRDGQQSLKEKLAESIVITSPTALRKRTAHQPSQNKINDKNVDMDSDKNTKSLTGVSVSLERNSDRKIKKPLVRRSARINSQKDNEASDQVCDTIEKQDTDKQVEERCNDNVRTSDNASNSSRNDSDIPECDRLERNDTEEFTPVFSETLSDSEVEAETKSIVKNMSNTGEGDDIQADMRLGNNFTNSSSQNITNNTGTNVDENVSKSDTQSIRHCVKTSSNEIKADGTEEHIEIWKEKETIEVKPVPTPKSCLQKQEAVDTGGKVTTLHKDIEALKCKAVNETSSKSHLKKFGHNKFINFQKSSSGTLSNEIEDFSYVGDYDVLDRSDKDTKKFSPKAGGMHTKNVKRRLKRTCKYRDLDSEINTENKEVISNIRNEQVDSKKVLHKNEEQVLESCNSNENSDSKKKGFIRENPLNVSNGIKSTIKSDKTASKPLSQRTNSEEQEQESKSVCTAEMSINGSIQSSVNTSVDGNKNGEAMLKEADQNQVGHSVSVKESALEDKCDNSGERTRSELDSSGNCSEKVTPNRQMSTGFTVNASSFERAPSTDSAVSFRNSPSRLFHLESGTCGTIVEEDIGEDFDKGDNGEESVAKINSDANFVFGVEDLLDVRKEVSPPVSQHLVNAQNVAKPFCDINANTDNNSKTQKVDKTISKLGTDTHSVSKVTFEEEQNKAGCSYHYVEPPDHLSPHRVVKDTGAEKDALYDERIPFLSKTLHQDDSSSRSSVQSITSFDRASPLSPLSISPFDFLNPISPLPPSPIRDIERVSPLSPEHTSDEQKLKLGDDKAYDIENNEEDIHESILRTDTDANSANSTDIEKQALTLENTSISQIEVNSFESKNENEDMFKTKKDDSFNVCDKVKNSKRKENRKKLEKVQDIPKMNANCDVDSLKLFNIPLMISPVKTPKSHSKVKNEQVKISKSINELRMKNEVKTEKSSVMEVNEENCFNQPKQFLTEAPESAVAVKPRPARGRTSLDKSNIEMCIRKSSRTALKRISSTDKIDPSKAKKVSVDAKGTAVGNTPGCELESDEIDLKTVNDTSNEITKASDRATDIVEMLPKRIEDSDEIRNKESIVEKIDEKGDSKVDIEECPQSHDNLAFKRKARVAHKPNIQPLKPHKIQIIDAPVLPPVTVGRKRKSLDNTKEAQDKKHCKESAFKKQKSSTPDRAINPESTKKMQTYLKSSETAGSFVSKFSTQVDKDGLHSELLNVCLECLGRVQTDTLEVVYRTCENGRYLTIVDQFPFMSDVDKKAVELIQYLGTELKTDLTVVMRKIWDRIFNRDVSTSMVGKMAQCRVFVALCSLQGDVEQARTLFYHLVTCGHLNCTLFIVSVVSVWPEVMKKDLSDRPDKVASHGMTLVLEEVITKMLLSQGSEANNKILMILQKLCCWSGITGNADSIIKILCSRLMAILDEENTDKSGVLELTKALELLCTSQSWQWCKEHFIMRHGLQTASNKYLAEKIMKPVPPEYVCAILRMTSQCMFALAASVKEREYQQIIRNWLLPVLRHKPGNAKVRQCCVETLLELSPLYPSCLDSIHKWFTEEKDNVSHEFTARLEYLRNQYKQKFGLQCKPFFKT